MAQTLAAIGFVEVATDIRKAGSHALVAGHRQRSTKGRWSRHSRTGEP